MCRSVPELNVYPPLHDGTGWFSKLSRMNATGFLGGQIHQLEGVSLVGLQVLRSRNFMEVSCAMFVCGACVWRAFFSTGNLEARH